MIHSFTHSENYRTKHADSIAETHISLPLKSTTMYNFEKKKKNVKNLKETFSKKQRNNSCAFLETSFQIHE